MTRRLASTVVAIGVLALAAACAPPKAKGPQTPVDARILETGNAFDRYSEADKALIRSGNVRPGLDELAAYIARGKPPFYWRTQLAAGNCNVLLYGRTPEEVDSAIYACEGTIEQVVEVEPTLPCWRLAAVAPRVVEKQAYFEGKPLPQQWEILEGILKRGQTGDDVYIAFGKPYNIGTEAREDGTNVSTRVYVDSTGEAYGLYITLNNDKVVGWKIPPDRQLTPEAQQKRLDATEARLMAQLKTMEQRAQQRHNEEMKLLNQLQSRGDEVVAKQTGGLKLAAMFAGPLGAVNTVTTAVQTTKQVVDMIDKPSEKAAPPPETSTPAKTEPPKGDSTSTAHVTSVNSEKTISIGTCSFHDTGRELGRACGKGLKACKAGYKCHAVPKAKGQCVPSAQEEACKSGASSPSTSSTPPPAPPAPGSKTASPGY